MPGTDLHLHSTFSDGDMTPAELVREACLIGLSTLAITDHDTVAGLPEAIAEADRLSIRLIPGIEITVRFATKTFTGSLHVLAYFHRRLLEDADFLEALKGTVSEGRGPALVEERVVRINREFGPGGRKPLLRRKLRTEEVSALSDNASRRHFAMALAEGHGLSKEKIGRIMGNDSPAYVPSGVPLERLADFFRNRPVVPVLAHPAAGSYPGESHYREVLPPLSTVEKLLPQFLAAGVSGLEVYYPGHTPGHVEHLLELADELGLVVTGGSDCHDRESRPMMGPGFVGDVSGFLALLDETVSLE